MADTEVLVIGAGTAGMPAAIFAADGGAHVTVLEKTNQLGGTLWFSSASMSGAGTRKQKEKGINDSPQSHYDDIWEIGRHRSDPDLLRLAVDHAAAGIDWLQDIGMPFTEETPRLAPEHELYSAARTHSPAGYEGQMGGGAGQRMMRAVEKEFNKRVDSGAIDIHYSAGVTELLPDASGAISGARYKQWDDSREIRADAVVLASGGYAANHERFRRHHAQYDHLLTIAPPWATGDGLDLAVDAGGVLTNMDLLVVLPGGLEDPRAPGICIYWIFLANSRQPTQSGDIWVNREGMRFIREDETSPDRRERAIMAQPHTEMSLIFDAPMREGLTPIVANAMQRMVEHQNPPVLVSAPSIGELAIKLGLPPAAVQTTVDRYNQFVDVGVDEEFGREAMPKKIDEPPFHGLPTSGTVIMSHGGVKANGKLQVMRADGSAIPNLFLAGEVMGAGQVMGDCFAGGQGIGMALTFGILAGKAAANVKVPARV